MIRDRHYQGPVKLSGFFQPFKKSLQCSVDFHNGGHVRLGLIRPVVCFQLVTVLVSYPAPAVRRMPGDRHVIDVERYFISNILFHGILYHESVALRPLIPSGAPFLTFQAVAEIMPVMVLQVAHGPLAVVHLPAVVESYVMVSEA